MPPMPAAGNHLREIAARALLKLGGLIQARGLMLVYAAEGHPIPKVPGRERQRGGNERRPAASGARHERLVLVGLLAAIVVVIVFQIGVIRGFDQALDRMDEARRAAEADQAQAQARAEAEAEAEAERFDASFFCVAHDLVLGRIRCVVWEQKP